jgi:hypothetical protein
MDWKFRAGADIKFSIDGETVIYVGDDKFDVEDII